MGLVLVTAPDEEPVTLLELKTHLRIPEDDTALDTHIASCLAAALGTLEDERNLQLCAATWQLVLGGFPRGRGTIILPRPPLISVDKVVYLDPDGVEVTSEPAGEGEPEVELFWAGSLGAEPGFVYLVPGESWPATARQPDALKVQFTAGYGAAAAVPERAKAAIKLLAATLFDQPASEVIETGARFAESDAYRRLVTLLWSPSA